MTESNRKSRANDEDRSAIDRREPEFSANEPLLPHDANWLSALANSLPQIIWTNDGRGVANYFNVRWYEYTGRTYEESLGRGWQLVVHPEDALDAGQQWQECVIAGVPFEYEYRLLSKDNEYRWFIGRNVPVFDENHTITSWFGTATDIEDLKRAQVDSVQSEARLRATLEGAADFAIVTIDADGLIAGWNSGAERAFGYAEHEVLGVHARLLFTEEDRKAGLPELEMLNALKNGRAEDERWHLHRSGSRFYMSGVMAPIQGGTNAGFVKVARDMTERRAADEALRRSEAQYRELAEDLSRTKEALLAADRQKDQFIATLAHELRNPLAPVRSAMEVISLTEPEDPQVLWALDVVKRQTQTMTRLIDDLMDVSRITQNKLLLRSDRINLSAVLREAIEVTRPLMEMQRQALSLHIPPEPIELIGDGTRLSQIFANLLDNAGKYSEPGGAITISAVCDRSTVSVRVTDTGIGIAEADLERIFSLFAQVRTNSDRGKGGLGIGLSLVQQLVRMHGGTITVHSDGPGKGSEFVVTLPLAEGASVPLEPNYPVAIEHFSFPGIRVLVVDDNVDAANGLDAMLTRVGATVRTAYDGITALRLAEEILPHILFLDIGLPQLSGHEVAAQIRSQPWGQDMVIVAISGWGSEKEKRRSYEVGIDRHLVKPADPARLMRLIVELLSLPD